MCKWGEAVINLLDKEEDEMLITKISFYMHGMCVSAKCFKYTWGFC